MLCFLIFSKALIAQVGINTISPTKDLDINGELRVRTLPDVGTDSRTIAADNDGNLGITSRFYISDAQTDIADSSIRVIVNASTSTILDNVDLGMTNTVTIPANREALIITRYSIPLGAELSDYPRNGYLGIRFLRNDTEAPSGSRKFSVPVYESPSNFIAAMGTLNALYTESIPAAPIERTITFKLDGYIEYYEDPMAGFSDTIEFVFNRYNLIDGDPNFNWGVGNLSTVLYLK